MFFEYMMEYVIKAAMSIMILLFSSVALYAVIELMLQLAKNLTNLAA